MQKNKIAKWVIYPLYSFSALVTAFLLSWVVMYSADFGYPSFYEMLDIDDHIEKFGPQNRYRSGLQFTEKSEHVRLFAAMNEAVHQDGVGLESLSYHLPNGRKIDQLLREPEIVHLQDVAHLINVFAWLGYIACLIWIGILLFSLKTKFKLPTLKQQAISMGGLVGICTLLVLVIGPVEVFYAFHVWLFPEEHQWFFYYQESLMTIIMKAPDLFGYIAIALTLLAMILFTLINLAVKRLTTWNSKMG
ncbi:DUF1461 domain-containing protein [Bermanella marisrubri]|uniref:DUF1461 domain-containing protein n=1 Tax=Bermanella marisrubri TaxID=207949 RepID=Q1N0K7_9GAMM|nr:DUF1461 domain-containing protein [Bermanella marisrubri]EAT11826.1 hypothetical protein RED65_05549 [Oceanobacter sp. RED65] [Bermanella marisrubri]QIZ83860.1 DUF1461 domain-containing protein [Bermanella marisrubri]